MIFASLASSSKGNCQFISYKNTNILVDCGISKKRIVENLREFNKTLDDIDAIFITHEHTDHISGLYQVLKGNNINVFSQRKTLEGIMRSFESKKEFLDLDRLRIIKPLNTFDEKNFLAFKDIKVWPVKGAHDVPSVFYKFGVGDTIIAILTDMGVYNDYTIRSLMDVNYLMLECNYDKDMIMECAYSAYLKARIMGDGGHLSNVDTCEIIMKIANKGLKEVYLSHISDESNNEEYALKFVTKFLEKNYKGVEKLPKIDIARRLTKTVILN